MSSMPPDYLLPPLYDIEKTILDIYAEHTRLADADVEWVCDKLAGYYKSLAKGKSVEEPESPSVMKQDLIDEILNTLEEREEKEMDTALINNPGYRHGELLYSSHAFLYSICLKRIKDSARFWRKKDGRTGYLRFISDSVI